MCAGLNRDLENDDKSALTFKRSEALYCTSHCTVLHLVTDTHADFLLYFTIFATRVS